MSRAAKAPETSRRPSRRRAPEVCDTRQGALEDLFAIPSVKKGANKPKRIAANKASSQKKASKKVLVQKPSLKTAARKGPGLRKLASKKSASKKPASRSSS